MLLGFKPRFVDPIFTGSKIHTLRKPRRVQPKIGEKLYTYTGLRTKHCRLISNKLTLKAIQKVNIIIYRTRETVGPLKSPVRLPVTKFLIIVDDRPLSMEQMREFAINDGFESIADFCDYWLEGTNGRIEEEMQCFHWTDFKYHGAHEPLKEVALPF